MLRWRAARPWLQRRASSGFVPPTSSSPEQATKTYQRRIYDLALASRLLGPFNLVRARARLARWPVPVELGLCPIRLQRNLEAICDLVPPRVLTAVWRTAWNGWCTTRRFQQGPAPCVLSCPTGLTPLSATAPVT